MLTLLLLLAVAALVLPAFAPASSHTVPVVTAARDLPAGHVLGPGDLEVADVAAELAPDAALAEPASAQGRRLTTAVPAGAAVAASSLRDADDPGTPAGLDVIAVPVDTSLVPYLTAGSRVRVLASTADPGVTRSLSATVVEDAEAEGSIAPGGDPGGTTTALLAVEPADSAEVAQATREGWVVVAVVR